MIVVSDTSPINYLVWIGHVELLRRLFGAVAIPPAVRDELLDPGTPARVLAWAATPPEWVTVYAVPPDLSPELAALDEGEREAIRLAERMAADLVLVDELAGRRRAAERGLAVTGLLGVLVEAARLGLVDLSDAIARLEATSFRASPALLEAVVAHAGRPRAEMQIRPADTALAGLRLALSATLRAHYEWLEGRHPHGDTRRAAVQEIREAMLAWVGGCDPARLPPDRRALAGDIRTAALVAASADPPDPFAVAAREAYSRYQALQRQAERLG